MANSGFVVINAAYNNGHGMVAMSYQEAQDYFWPTSYKSKHWKFAY